MKERVVRKYIVGISGPVSDDSNMKPRGKFKREKKNIKCR